MALRLPPVEAVVADADLVLALSLGDQRLPVRPFTPVLDTNAKVVAVRAFQRDRQERIAFGVDIHDFKLVVHSATVGGLRDPRLRRPHS
jgi:hypothetical protein